MIVRPNIHKTRPAQFSWLVFAALAAVLLLLARSAARPLPTNSAHAAQTGQTVAVSPERIPLATNSHTVTYQEGKQYESVISAEQSYYQDDKGDWRSYNVEFANLGENYVVENNTLRSRAGQDRAWVSAGAGETAIHWQAESLGLVAADGSFAPIASAIEDSNHQAQPNDSGTRLRYDGSWTNAAIAEALISERDSIEHVLIIDELLPEFTHGTQFDTQLEMQAQLQLLPGATLWAQGQEQLASFSTTETLEIRDKAGNLAMIFDPVVAFEQENPEQRVAGSYHLEPNADGWLVKVRTPLSWWTDVNRSYPLILDPTMRVERTSGGFGGGMAWVGNDPQSGSQPYTGGNIVLGTYYSYGGASAGPDSAYPGWDSKADGYMQFNVLPGLLENSPMKIKSASLEFAASRVGGPFWRSEVDWDSKTTQGTISLHNVGACPDQCGGFSLHDNRVSDDNLYNWDNRPLGNSMGAQTITSPSYDVSASTNPPTMTWDVTNVMTSWYANEYDSPNRPKPTFRVTLDTPCLHPGPYVGNFSTFSLYCGRWVIPYDSVKLHITYEPLDLPVYTDVLNEPGIATYAEGILADSFHEYHLPATTANRWRGIAVRGDHKLGEPAAPARIGFNLTSEFLEGINQLADDALYHGFSLPDAANETAFLFIDDQAPQPVVNNTDLWARVQPMDDNHWQDDPDRNYRIEHTEASDLIFNEPPSGLVYGQKYSRNVSLNSSNLVSIRDLYAESEDNLDITISAPDSLGVYLLHPTGASNLTDAVVDEDGSEAVEAFDFDNGVFSFKGEVAKIGRYGLAFVNNDRPFPDADRPDFPGNIQITVEVVRCPKYTVYTHKYQACQPIILPPNSPSRDITVEVGGGTKSLKIHSEGGFTGNGAAWCTQNENQGTPIIEQPGESRYIYVAQGSVCFEDGRLTTSEDAGVGLTPHVATVNNRRRGKHMRFLFGDSGQLLPGDKDGELTLFTTTDASALFSLVAKDEETWVRLGTVFDAWGDTYAPDGNLGINLHTIKVGESGQLNTKITTNVSVAPYERRFETDWELYPKEVTEFNYGVDPAWDFQISAEQDSPLPTVITDLEGLQLRILNASNQPTGLFTEFDSIEPLLGLPKVNQFRAEKGRLTADAALGGASIDAQFVIMPPGRPLQPFTPEGMKDCESNGQSTSCFDIRRDDYNWGNGQGSVGAWKLPDLHVENTAQTMAISTPGNLSVFSGDHPRAGVNAQDEEFSFDTWEATVQVAIEPCTDEENAPDVTVVKGEAMMSMPNVNDGGGAGIKIKFKICETALAQVYFEASFAPTGIVVGSTGVKLQFISMNVLIDPNQGYAEITFVIKFDSVDGETMTDFVGEITIDTRGLFEIEASGKFFSGMLDTVSFKLAVAWNPFDMLFEGEAHCCDGGNLISGGIRLHGWVGQGWQSKYDWLPDDSEFHFTGTIWAELNIETGMVVDEFPFILPPFDFSLKITVSFGEFCVANTNCQTYEWGISGVLTVMGYDVGVYVSESGVDLILGTNDHILIDQYTGGSRVVRRDLAGGRAAPQPIQPGNQQPHLQTKVSSSAETWATSDWGDHCTNEGNGVHTCAFEMSNGNGRALFVSSWLNGTLEGSLIRPDNSVISMTNAIQNNAVYSSTVNANVKQFSFALESAPGQTLQPGTWKLQLTGVVEQPDPFPSNYKLLFAGDEAAADIEWITPVNAISADSTGKATIEWNATRSGSPLGADIKLDLFAIPLADKPITPTVMAGTPLANGIAANGGSLTIDVAALGSGDYAIGARIDDHLTGNGTVISWAPGYISYFDTTPPPVPTIIGQSYAADGLLHVSWKCDTDTPDLAGYLVQYTIPDWNPDGSAKSTTRRATPGCPLYIGQYKLSLFESIGLGGLSNSQWSSNQLQFETEVCVRSYDASFNVSGCEKFPFQVPTTPDKEVRPPTPVLARQRNQTSDVTVLWEIEPGAMQDGFIVSYEPLGCRVPGYDASSDPASPVTVPDGTYSHDFDAMTMWQMYHFEVRAYTNSGQISAPNSYDLRPIVAVDADNDGLYDGWADLYGITDASADADQDGLTNGDEYLALTNPIHADSDGDGFYDGEEAAWGTDGCDHNQSPPYHDRSKMMVAGVARPTLVGAVNNLVVAPQHYVLWNAGAGELQLSAETFNEWLQIDLVQDAGLNTLDITIKPDADLEVGTYEGEVVIVNKGESRNDETETVTIPVLAVITEPQQETVPTSVSMSSGKAGSTGMPSAWLILVIVGMTAWTVLEREWRLRKQ